MTQNYLATFSAVANTGAAAGLHTLYSNPPFTIVGRCVVGTAGSTSNIAETFITSSEAPAANQGDLSSGWSGDVSGFNSASTAAGVDNGPGAAATVPSYTGGGNTLGTEGPGAYDLVRPAGSNVTAAGGTQYSGAGSATNVFYGYGFQGADGGYFNAVSSSGATALNGVVGNGVTTGGSNCLFEGSISHTP